MHIRGWNQQAYRDFAESLETDEHCWEIETAFPVPCWIDDNVLRVEPMILSHEALGHLDHAIREGKEGQVELTISSYAYTNGRASFTFGTKERANHAITLMVEQGLITLEYEI